MGKHYRGNESVDHYLTKQNLVYILEHMGRNVKTEYEVFGIHDESNRVVDVADVTDPKRHVYYEIEQKSDTPRMKHKMEVFKKQRGIDIVVVDLEKMHRELGKDPGVLQVRRWLQDLIL